MKKSVGVLIALLCVVTLFTGCGTVYTPVVGSIYADVSWPGDIGSGDGTAQNQGVSYAESFVGIYAAGDASISAALDNAEGGIDSIAWVDYHAQSIWFIYGKLETYVYGN